MKTPKVISERLSHLSADCGVELMVVRFWENEFRAGWYCRFRGVAIKSEFLVIELAGTLAVELEGDGSDEIDLFVFVNGIRVSPFNEPNSYKYLWRRGSDSFRWDYLDDGAGYEQFHTLEDDGWRPERGP